MSIRNDLECEPIGSLQLRPAILLDPYTIVRGAIARMRSESLGCAIIVDAGQIPRGIFTERSVLEILATGVSLDERPVCDFSDPSFLCVLESEPIVTVWDAIQQNDARFVCVTDKDGRAIGLTGQRGIAEYLSECFAKQITSQRIGSTPWVEQREGA